MSTGVAQDTGNGKEDMVPIRATNVELTPGVSVLDLLPFKYLRPHACLCILKGLGAACW